MAGKVLYLKEVKTSNGNTHNGGIHIRGDCYFTVTYSTVSHPTVTAGNPIKNSDIASLRFYKGGPETGPGVGVKIEPFVIGTKNTAITAAQYNNA